MHSIKNTVVAVFLLGVTYTVYQSISTPEPVHDDTALLELTVEDMPIRGATKNLLGEAKESFGGLASDFSNKATDSAKGLVNDLSRKADQLVQSTQQKAQEFVDEAAEIPEDLLQHDSSAASTSSGSSSKITAFTDQNDFNPGSGTKLTAPPLVNNSLGQSDKDLLAGLSSTINNQSPQYKSPAGQNKTPLVEGLTDVRPRPPIFDANVAPVSTATRTLEAAWPEVIGQVRQQDFNNALQSLSEFYKSPLYAGNEKLLKWLDLLAAKVIYSSEHHLRNRPYVVQPGDKIADLARRWEIPAQLIYNTNRDKITNPNSLTAGTELKIIQGPFHAEVDSEDGVLTLYLHGMYAGRFNVQSGSDVAVGDFGIVNKSVAGKAGMPHWISLSNGSSIYGASDSPVANSNVGLSPQEAADVFAILSASSTVRVLR